MSKTSNKPHKNKCKRRKTVSKIIISVTAFAILSALFFTLYFIEKRNDAAKNLDLVHYIEAPKRERSKIYHYDFTNRVQREGELSEEYDEIVGGYQSIYTPIDNMPEHLKYAFVAIEDKRFFSHHGVDAKRTAAAALNFIKEKFLNRGKRSFGASTITQQIVKNVNGKDEYSVKRKIEEIFEALALEDYMSKDEILEIYLNVINLSGGCRGVGAASKYYFGKDVSELTVAESASLAAITNSPSAYNPYNHPKDHLSRRNLIIDQMYAQGYIGENEAIAAKAKEIGLAEKRDFSGINSWYTDMVIEDVIHDLCERKGYSYTDAVQLVYYGGLKIYSAENREMQNILNEYFADKNNFTPLPDGTLPQSSMIIIDPFTGDILAVAGGIGEKRANRIQNYATMTKRPSGSVIKPLSVYAPALDRGIINWASVFDDVPLEFNKNGEDYIAWPKNFGDRYEGLVNVNYALTHSTNTVAVKVLRALGKERSFSFLRDKVGMNSLIKNETVNGRRISDVGEASLALGQMNLGVTLKEMTGAYSIFPSGGIFLPERSYYRVTDKDGNIILSNSDTDGERAIRKSSAAIMTKMLQNVVLEGSARYVSLKNKTEVAGKTGTTQGDRDKWFIGFTPSLLGGVWSGFDGSENLKEYRHNPCLDVWDSVMERIYDKVDGYSLGEEFEIPQNVFKAEYCKDSGKLLSDICSLDVRGKRSETGYFTADNMPDGHCVTHQKCLYDEEGEGIIPFSSIGGLGISDKIREIALIRAYRSFPKEIFITDAQYVYRFITPDKISISNDPFFEGMRADGEFFGRSMTKKHFNRASKRLAEILELRDAE